MLSEKRIEIIQEVFKERLTLFGARREEILETLIKCTEEEGAYLKFLYSTMPISDVANYPVSYFLEYARHGLYLRKNNPFSKVLPEEIFLNYVLHHRINEEEIAPCREFFYEKLIQRVIDKPVKEAVLEANYWCSEEATYQSTDERTVSPLTVYKGAYGRCGEESTFTVSVLRSIGIPARQVYAPRWSHCDDNHAWVEVWIEGKWYFLGACEPEEVLNKGWFTNASSRAMLVHSRWFDVIPSEEEKIEETGVATLLNHLPLYAHTKCIEVSVIDEKGMAVEGALVDFEVLNYAEFYPIASVLTDELGKACLTTGLGNLQIHVSKNGIYRETLIDVKEQEKICMVLKNEEVFEAWVEKEMNAPVDAQIHKVILSAEQKENGKIKFKEAAGKRALKVQNFFENALETEKEWVELARGNFEEIKKFMIDEETASHKKWKEKMLAVLTKKDFRDAKSEVLLEHLNCAMAFINQWPEETFVNYILNPRILLEPMTSYRGFIQDYYTQEQKEIMKNDPKQIWERIEQSIQVRNEIDYPNITTSPVGCLSVGIGSELSKKMLFVAICRTLGIPAKLNAVDQSIEYMQGEIFVPVKAGADKKSIIQIVSEQEEVVWTYAQNWSLAKLEEGRYRTLQLGQVVWSEAGISLKVEAGIYRVITANRLPNGNIFAKTYHIDIAENQVVQVALSLKEAQLDEMLEQVQVMPFELKDETEKVIKASEVVGEGKKILMWLEESKEPTEHILNEILENEEAFKGFEKQVVMIIKNQEALKDPTLKKVLERLEGITIYYDDFEENVNILGRRMYVDPDKLPLIVVIGEGLKGIYATSGYNVGTGEMLLRILRAN